MIKKILITVFIVGLISPFMLIAYYYNSYDYDMSKLVDYKPSISSRIYDKQGQKIANVFDKKHRFYAPFEEIPPRVIDALVAIEDTSFFEHPGINIDAIFRAAVKVVLAGHAVQGASTITQQLVKNVLLTREKKLSRKIKEAIFALKIEKVLTKEQILERYLNEIYYGHSYYGIKTAADGYFHKNLDELSLKEIAMLTGLPKAPSTYTPTKNYELSIGRANRVVTRLYDLGWIDEEMYKEALAENPVVFDDTLTENKAPFIVDEVARRMEELGIKDFKTGGYKVYTTIDLKLQEAARESLKYAYDGFLGRIEKYIEKEKQHPPRQRKGEDPILLAKDINASKLNGAMVSIEPKTGNILALVGSVDYTQSSFNRATQGQRQPGSAFKPFIYQVALNLGYSGATELVDIAKTYDYKKNGKDEKWQPANFEHNYKGLVTLRESLVHSRNLATINLVNDIGLEQLIKELNKFNIKDLPNDLSISLGTMSISPLQLAEYYTIFSNYGKESKTHLINTVVKDGETIYKKKYKRTRVTPETQAFIMTTILRDVVEHGTGLGARVHGIELAGKTGTTNNSMDGWFAGYSPDIETIVWFGNDDNTPIYRRETGGRISAPAFRYFYQRLLRIYPQVKREFDVPKGIQEVKIGEVDEYFSDISKAPKIKVKAEAEEELMF